MKKNRWIAIILLVAALGGAFVAYRQFFASSNEAEVAPPSGTSPSRRPPLSVRAVVVETKPIIDYINATGTLMASEEVDLSFESSGRITFLSSNEGQKVSEGELLAKINDNELQAQRDKINVQLKLSEDREQRQRTLLEHEAISRESYEQSLAEMQALKADLALIEAKIEKSSILAPFDGTLGLRYTSEGAFVSPGTPVAHVVCISPLKVDFSIPERYAADVRTGMNVQFRIDGVPRLFEAKVYAIEPQVNVKTRTIMVRALYANSNSSLKPGQFFSLTLQLKRFDNAIAIPNEALIAEMDGDLVYLYRSGKAAPIRVKKGIRSETEIQITSGLAVGDTLITSGMLQLRTGMAVQIMSQDLQD